MPGLALGAGVALPAGLPPEMFAAVSTPGGQLPLLLLRHCRCSVPRTDQPLGL